MAPLMRNPFSQPEVFIQFEEPLLHSANFYTCVYTFHDQAKKQRRRLPLLPFFKFGFDCLEAFFC